jgi:hypothetical protein
MAKIYLSPAAHEHDNPCSYDKKCGENIHCNLYLDELEAYLKACGIQYKRANKANTGDNLKKSVTESNAYKPDLHYVCHTNAFNGTVKGNRLFSYDLHDGYKFAGILKKHRATVYPYPIGISTNQSWYEMNSTKSVSVYDELVFHDNKDDCTWFHKNMRKYAEVTARAFCEYFKIKFVDPYAKPPEPKPEPPKPKKYAVQIGTYDTLAQADDVAGLFKNAKVVGI